MKQKIVIILGPTGVGKSDVAREVALRVDGEIINTDSQQVYRYLDIGTGKPSPEQRQKVPHHLIDIVDPKEIFDAAAFCEAAIRITQEIGARGKKVIVCGGTGLYIKTLTQGLFAGPGRDPKTRKALERQAAEKGLAFLHERLSKSDPEAACRIHPNDRQRIIRALEVFELTGKTISQWQKEHGFKERFFESLKIGLRRERSELYDLIDRRCDDIVAGGLIEEVKGLLNRGYSADLGPLQSIGYRHVALYLSGAASLEEAVSVMKRDTRRLAKRQLTWFRADREIHWFHPDEEIERLLATVGEFFSMS